MRSILGMHSEDFPLERSVGVFIEKGGRQYGIQ